MLAVDWLIQRVHSKNMRAAVAVNLIAGAEAKVMEFLDRLFIGLGARRKNAIPASWRRACH
jgi:hypothetical protein